MDWTRKNILPSYVIRSLCDLQARLDHVRGVYHYLDIHIHICMCMKTIEELEEKKEHSIMIADCSVKFSFKKTVAPNPNPLKNLKSKHIETEEEVLADRELVDSISGTSNNNV